ncbi:MAG TPA: MarR family transcriptional regulator [Rhizobium sp.]
MFERTLFHAMRALLQEHTALWVSLEPDLTKPQYAVLEALAQKREMDQVSLGRASATTKATLTEMLRRMEQRGLIERQACKSDARQKHVRLTPAGLEKLIQARATANAVSGEFLTSLSEEEHETLLNLIQKMRQSPFAKSDQTP